MSGNGRRNKRFHGAPGFGGRGSRPATDGGTNPCKLFVGNISYKVTERELEEFFADYGPVKHCQIVREHHKGRSRGIGFVTFKSVEAAEKALAAPEDRLILDGRTLRVDRPTTKKRLLAMQDALGTGEEVEEEVKVEMKEEMKEGGVNRDLAPDNQVPDASSKSPKPRFSEAEDAGIPKTSSSNEPASSVTGGGNLGVSILELNDDILLHILSCLQLKDRIRLERVNRWWCRVARASWQYVKHLSFRNVFKSFQGKYGGGLSDEILHSVLRRGCRNLTSLDLSFTPQFLTDYGMDLIGMYCGKLERLDLSGVSVTQASFRQLSQRSSGLKWLKISGCHTVGEKCVWWGLHNCKQLQFLDLSDNRRVNGQCFYMAGSTLRHVHLQQCDKLTDSSLELLASRCPHLETVDVSHCPKLTGSTIRTVTQLRQVTEVDYIEEETTAQGAQIPYHLDRIDQRLLPLNGDYSPTGTGEGVDIYILDSGVYYSHEEFENRAKYSGFDPMDIYLGETRRGNDCFGHGTHVASNAAGVKYGAAKKATVYSVRVLDCQNAGPWSTTLAGLDHVMEVIAARRRPAIVSMSLSGGYQQSVNDAVRNLYNSGVPVVAAAGNSRSDACSATPAGATGVITVAGSADGDGLYFATSYGSCVDIFAPGDTIRGADFGCRDCSQHLSGTSFSAPIVSGAIAILLQRQPLLTPDEIKSELISLSVSGRLDFSAIPSNFRAVTPNRALYIPGSCGGEISIDFRSSATIQSPNYPSNYLENVRCSWVITAPQNSRIRLSFSNFETESLYDTVELCSSRCCDGSSVLATLSGRLATSARLYQSTSNVLSVELTTDGRVASTGFRATVSAIEVEVPPTDSQPTTAATTSAPTTTNPTTATVTCPTPPPPPPPPPMQNISMILQDTLFEAEVLLNRAIGTTLGNLLRVKLDEVDQLEPPTNTATVSTIPTRPTLPTTSTSTTASTQPPTTASTQPSTTASTQPPTQSSCLGCREDNPAFYCQDIAMAIGDTAKSGYYWVRGRYGVNRVYCDMSPRFMNTPGWMRVADVDMSDPNQDCPNGLGLISSPKRTCGRSNSFPGCSSALFSTLGVAYSRICGRIIGYQYSTPNAFFAHQYDTSITIDDYYVDGVSLTRGSPRNHIWSFAAALQERSSDRHICPCTHDLNSLPESAVPPFIGDDYFCDSGTDAFQRDVFYSGDPLWDGQGCGPDSSCCSFNNPPWFCKDLRDASTDSVEMRICGNQNTSDEDTPVEIIELFVQ